MSIRNEDRGAGTLLFAELERIGGQIPGGFLVYRADESQEMLYVNSNVLRIFGCDTLEEYKALTGYTFRGLVYPEDYERIQSSIEEQIADSGYAQFEFTVSDTGAGMTEEHLRRVREALECGEWAEKADRSGSGHGLAVAKRLLNTMGGTLSLRSCEGKGTTAVISIPFRLAAHNRRQQFDSMFSLLVALAQENPVYLFDFHTQTARFSPALPELLGTPDELFSGANGLYFWTNYLHPDDRERFMRSMWEANEFMQLYFDLRVRIRVRSGVYEPVRVFGGVTRKPVGAEALLRWKSDAYGELTPLRFLADIEGESGFLELSRDCQSLGAGPLRDFAAPLRARGVRIGLDDYGSGSAWFDALRKMGAEYVKFSNEFIWNAVRGGRDLSTLRHLALLADDYGAEVYVKAVETPEMLEILGELPVRGVQGRYCSESVYFDEILELIQAKMTPHSDRGEGGKL